jgi:hypothetical protein
MIDWHIYVKEVYAACDLILAERHSGGSSRFGIENAAAKAAIDRPRIEYR